MNTDTATTAALAPGAKVALYRLDPWGERYVAEFTIAEQKEDGFTHRTCEGHSGRNLTMIRTRAHVALAEVAYFDADGWRNLPGLTERKARRYATTPLGLPGFRI